MPTHCSSITTLTFVKMSRKNKNTSFNIRQVIIFHREQRKSYRISSMLNVSKSAVADFIRRFCRDLMQSQSPTLPAKEPVDGRTRSVPNSRDQTIETSRCVRATTRKETKFERNKTRCVSAFGYARAEGHTATVVICLRAAVCYVRLHTARSASVKAQRGTTCRPFSFLQQMFLLSLSIVTGKLSIPCPHAYNFVLRNASNLFYKLVHQVF